MIIETSLLGSDSISTNRTLSTMVNGFIHKGVVCDDDDDGVDDVWSAEDDEEDDDVDDVTIRYPDRL